MEEIFKMLSGLNIPEEEMKTIMESAKENPMAAFGMLQQYMTPEIMQEMMLMAMSNPEIIQGMAEEHGISDEQIDALSAEVAK